MTYNSYQYLSLLKPGFRYLNVYSFYSPFVSLNGKVVICYFGNYRLLKKIRQHAASIAARGLNSPECLNLSMQIKYKY